MDLNNVLINLHKNKGLILNITNYVSVNDVANIILASKNSPLMSDEILEIEELTNIAKGININIGTANHVTSKCMLSACKYANEKNKVICLDPVGAGASSFRNELTLTLIKNVNFNAICCNISEFLFIAKNNKDTVGVDASENDLKYFTNISNLSNLVRAIAKKLNTVIVVSGPIDVISDGKQVALVRNGHPNMAYVTGCGCMLSALITTFIATNPNKCFDACLSACLIMAYSGEMACKEVEGQNLGNLSIRQRLIDNVFKNCEMPSNIKGFNYEIF